MLDVCATTAVIGIWDHDIGKFLNPYLQHIMIEPNLNVAHCWVSSSGTVSLVQEPLGDRCVSSKHECSLGKPFSKALCLQFRAGAGQNMGIGNIEVQIRTEFIWCPENLMQASDSIHAHCKFTSKRREFSTSEKLEGVHRGEPFARKTLESFP